MGGAELGAAIVFAPVGALMVTALRHSGPGARIVSAGIEGSLWSWTFRPPESGSGRIAMHEGVRQAADNY